LQFLPDRRLTPARLCQDYGFQTLYEVPQTLQLEMREKLIVDHAALLQEADNLLLNYSVCGFLA
jgi:hypothetical protein